MLDGLVEWAARNRLLVVLALPALIAAASLLLQRLNLDAFPDVTNIQVTVNTEAPGLAAEEVEQLISFPIEAVMYALPDVREVRSISKTGLSIVTVAFAEGTDVYFARQLVFERLQEAREQVPPGVGVPEMGPNTSGLGQVFQYVLRTDDPERFDAMRLRSLNDWVVKLLLMPVVDGARSRLRPELMTALTTVLGLAPLLVATGVGSEVQRPLATVVVGGLVSATFLTLVLLPVLYSVFSPAGRRGELDPNPDRRIPL